MILSECLTSCERRALNESDMMWVIFKGVVLHKCKHGRNFKEKSVAPLCGGMFTWKRISKALRSARFCVDRFLKNKVSKESLRMQFCFGKLPSVELV